MNTVSAIRGIATLLASAALSACMAPGATTGHGGHHAGPKGEASAVPGGAMAGGGQAGATMGAAGPGQAGSMEMGGMCAMHRNMQAVPPDQRAAMMEQHMKGMSPEMRQHHLEMMRKHCQ